MLGGKLTGPPQREAHLGGGGHPESPGAEGRWPIWEGRAGSFPLGGEEEYGICRCPKGPATFSKLICSMNFLILLLLLLLLLTVKMTCSGC